MAVEQAPEGWFHALDPGDLAGAEQAIIEGHAARPRDWPTEAVDGGFSTDRANYYRTLARAAVAAAQTGVRARAEADDERIKQQVRTLDDLDRVTNELAERIAEWARATGLTVDGGIDAIIALGEAEVPDGSEGIRRVAIVLGDLRTERDRLETDIERSMPDVAPNLTALAGPLLGARLIALAGDLESLAKLPSGTVQVLGAEDALFAHLHGGAPSPKHGIIFTHEYVHGTSPSNRGSAARALAGKLAIAARIDHYAGDLRPDLERDLRRRIQQIRGRED